MFTSVNRFELLALKLFTIIAADIKPRSLSEQLILHGFLLPRPASKHHPARFLLPPEVRHWLPRPLALPDYGSAPPPAPAPALRAATAILLACTVSRPIPSLPWRTAC